MTNDRFAELFGISVRGKNEKAEQIHFDLGASAQLVLEEILLKFGAIQTIKILKINPFMDIYYLDTTSN